MLDEDDIQALELYREHKAQLLRIFAQLPEDMTVYHFIRVYKLLQKDMLKAEELGE